MYPGDKDILERLLILIDHGEYALALQSWCKYRHKVAQTCSHCPYKEVDKDDDCCMCLEGKLRMMSLYQHSGNPFNDALLDAARKLDAYHRDSRYTPDLTSQNAKTPPIR